MRKGQVFVTDSVLAAFVLSLLTVTSVFYLQDAYKASRWNDVNMMRTAYDIGVALDRSDVIASNNRTVINRTLYRLMPKNARVALALHRYHYVQGNLSQMESVAYGDAIEDNYVTQRITSADTTGGYYAADIKVAPR